MIHKIYVCVYGSRKIKYANFCLSILRPAREYLWIGRKLVSFAHLLCYRKLSSLQLVQLPASVSPHFARYAFMRRARIFSRWTEYIHIYIYVYELNKST